MIHNNGKNGSKWEQHLHSFLLTLSTAAAIGAFTFLWNLNRNVGIIQDHDFLNNQKISNFEKKVDDLVLKVEDLTFIINQQKNNSDARTTH